VSGKSDLYTSHTGLPQKRGEKKKEGKEEKEKRGGRKKKVKK
jgi:hypothetical protein